MKTNRNDSCPCGSGKKIKNCCKSGNFNLASNNWLIKWIIKAFLGLFVIVLVWGIVEFFITDHPEMESYKCDNPNCGKIHYRPKTDTN